MPHNTSSVAIAVTPVSCTVCQAPDVLENSQTIVRLAQYVLADRCLACIQMHESIFEHVDHSSVNSGAT